MRRIVTGTAAYLSDLRTAVLNGWTAFFFTPRDPTALGLLRVVTGLLLFWNMLVFGLDLRDFFGSDGWVSLEGLQFVRGQLMPYAWSFWKFVPDALLWPVWIGCMVTLGLFTVGLFSRVTALLAWIIVVSTVRRVPVALFGFDQVISTLALYVAVTGASGQAVSLDRFLARWKMARAATARRLRDARWPLPAGVPEPTISANLAIRLLQLHLCLIYASSGLAKLQGPGWWDGTAIWGLVGAGEFSYWNFTWLAAHPFLLNLLTHASLAVEISYAVLIWVRPIRPLMLAAVVGLHLGIGVIAPGLTEFGLAMIAANLAFVSGSWLRSLVVGQDRSKPAARVLYDGACPRCRASMAVLTAADPDRLVDPVDLTAVNLSTIHPSLTQDACMRAMHVVRADGRVFAGYDGVLAVSWLLPLFWPLSLVGSLPVVRQAGRQVYQFLADRRPRNIPCTDDVCGIHGTAPPARTHGNPRRSATVSSSAPSASKETEGGR